jgi:hypothetical protein
MEERKNHSLYESYKEDVWKGKYDLGHIFLSKSELKMMFNIVEHFFKGIETVSNRQFIFTDEIKVKFCFSLEIITDEKFDNDFGPKVGGCCVHLGGYGFDLEGHLVDSSLIFLRESSLRSYQTMAHRIFHEGTHWCGIHNERLTECYAIKALGVEKLERSFKIAWFVNQNYVPEEYKI